MSRVIEFYVSDGFQLLDLSGPLTAFRLAEAHSPGTYTAVVVSDMGASVRASCGVSITSDTPRKARDTLIVVGVEVLDIGFSANRGTIATMALHSRRVASICTGAFGLAAAGLLDGKRATTHWRYAPRLQAEFPKVVVKPDKIFIKDGCVWTSAGITAGRFGVGADRRRCRHRCRKTRRSGHGGLSSSTWRPDAVLLFLRWPLRPNEWDLSCNTREII